MLPFNMNMNPMQMMNTIKNGMKNPEQFVVNMVGNQMNNPIINQLIDLARKGKNEEVLKIAKNIFKEKGENFDSQFSEFMSNFK